jgi:hypothetical protein
VHGAANLCVMTDDGPMVDDGEVADVDRGINHAPCSDKNTLPQGRPQGNCGGWMYDGHEAEAAADDGFSN